MRKPSGFTLVELLIVMALLAVLAGIVYPVVADVGEFSRAGAMATTVNTVREKIVYHAAVGDVPLSMEGYPNDISPGWFAGGQMPRHAWTERPLKIQVVHGPKSARYPNKKWYTVKPDGDAAGPSAWYNAATGAFCVLVPKIGTEDERIELFNRVNNADVEAGGGGGGGGDDDDDDDDDDDS